ncbi:MAG: aspartyl protease family protein [Saprospiraceae bacterium]|nr:aspartyl protease family protein [Lewinella sp.]
MQTIFTQLTTILLLILGITPFLRAQSVSITQIPFQNIRNLIYVEGQANSQSGFFLVDTGYEGSLLLNSKHFSGKPTEQVIVGTNGEGSSLEVKVVDFHLGNIQTDDLVAYIADMTHLENSLGLPLVGLIGSTFFQDFELMFDYTGKNMILTRLDKRGKKLVSFLDEEPPTDSLSFVTKGHLPVFKARIGEVSLMLALDSGASANLFHQGTLKKLEEHLSDLNELHMNGFGLESKKTTIGLLSQLQIQGLILDPMQTLFSNLTHLNRELRGPMVDGILSLDYFGQRKVAFNFRKQVLYVWEDKPTDTSTETYMVQGRQATPATDITTIAPE